ncbi:MAG TPA: DUF1416 domain-containing protein [Actinophytocola sp.]|uniref:DUF1416 domain-containing protein n=1 Tax=Actinophytocola sp. TaxID=1872138 RepID=UPI002DB5E23D|nr:DUF1416 domain-containing protein [Actinophytocola sp.]HEU5474126.1 DUF1416 domain-containing protein [Actinophytocola sp.]
MSCGAPEQSAELPAGVDIEKEVVVSGRVTAAGAPVAGAFVRLLDAGGEFTAEVVSSPEGAFLFYAAPGDWTVRALHRSGNGEAKVSADGPGLHPVAITVG